MREVLRAQVFQRCGENGIAEQSFPMAIVVGEHSARRVSEREIMRHVS
jgi:hypothetical protein